MDFNETLNKMYDVKIAGAAEFAQNMKDVLTLLEQENGQYTVGTGNMKLALDDAMRRYEIIYLRKKA